jgi:UDP-N-acetylmuramoyl-L-alanyl-D-glutamate--2,6-diaminopimelate ligase
MRAKANSAGRDVTNAGVSHASGESHSQLAVSVKQNLPLVKFFQCQDIMAQRWTMHVDEAGPGDVVCFQTGANDPVTFAATALARGAAAILTEQLLPCPLPQAVVGDVQEAACRIATALHNDPASQMLTIGIVGDGGKTSTALLIAGLLKKIGIRTAYDTDLGSSDGIVQSTPAAGASDGVELISRLADARDAGCGAMVVEMNDSEAGANGSLKLDLVVVTGTYAAAGNRIARGHFGPDPLTVALEQAKRDAVVIVPADQPKLVHRIAESGMKRLSYGLLLDADVSAKLFDQQPGMSTLMVSCGDETAAMESVHCGEAMALNSLAAVAVARLLDTPLTEAISAISGLPMIPGRMQRLSGYDTAAVVIDAARTPEQLAVTLRTLRQQLSRRGKLWCLLTLGAQADAAEDDDLQLARCGRLVERFSQRIVLTSTVASKATFLRSAHAVLDGFKNVALARLITDPAGAVQWAVGHAAPEDTILIITADDDASPYERRKSLQALEAAVEQARESAEVQRYRPAMILTMPGVGASAKATETGPAAS